MKKIYSFNHQVGMTPGASGYTSQVFRLPATSGFERSLDQFIFNVVLYDTASSSPIPLEQNTIVNYYLQITTVNGNIANQVDIMGLTAAETGTQLLFLKPGLYCMNGLVTNKEIRFNLLHRNTDPVANIVIRWSFVIETDEKYI